MKIGTVISQMEEEDALALLASMKGTKGDDEYCGTCIHEAACAEIGGRQEGRGFGVACRLPWDRPHYQRRQ